MSRVSLRLLKFQRTATPRFAPSGFGAHSAATTAYNACDPPPFSALSGTTAGIPRDSSIINESGYDASDDEVPLGKGEVPSQVVLQNISIRYLYQLVRGPASASIASHLDLFSAQRKGRLEAASVVSVIFI